MGIARNDGGENLVIEGFMPRFQNLIDSNRYLYRPRASGLESFARRGTRNKHKNWSITVVGLKPLWHESELAYARYRCQNVSFSQRHDSGGRGRPAG